MAASTFRLNEACNSFDLAQRDDIKLVQELVMQNGKFAQAWKLNQRRLQQDVGCLAEQLESELRTREAIEELENRTRQLQARRRAWEDSQAAQRDCHSRETEARRERVITAAERIAAEAQERAASKERRREARLEAFAHEKDAYDTERAMDAEARSSYASAVAARAHTFVETKSKKCVRQQAELAHRRRLAEKERAAEQARRAQERRLHDEAIAARQREHDLRLQQQRDRKEARFAQKRQKADEYEAQRNELLQEMARARGDATRVCNELRELAFQAACSGRLTDLHGRLAELSPRVRSPSNSSARRLSRPESARGTLHCSSSPRGWTPRRRSSSVGRTAGYPGRQALPDTSSAEAPVHVSFELAQCSQVKVLEAETASGGAPSASTAYGSPPSSGSLSNASATRRAPAAGRQGLEPGEGFSDFVLMQHT